MGVAPQAANCYLSHAIRRNVGTRDVADNASIRTGFAKRVLSGLSRTYDREHPGRGRTRVPLSYSLVVTAVDVVNGLFGNPTDRIVMHAALAVAYGLSLRPGEYLAMTGTSERALNEQAPTYGGTGVPTPFANLNPSLRGRPTPSPCWLVFSSRIRLANACHGPVPGRLPLSRSTASARSSPTPEAASSDARTPCS